MSKQFSGDTSILCRTTNRGDLPDWVGLLPALLFFSRWPLPVPTVSSNAFWREAPQLSRPPALLLTDPLSFTK